VPSDPVAPVRVVSLVRHACAGVKDDWDGSDLERPLDDAGRVQAEELAQQLGRRRVRRLASSPARRCIDTLSPLSRLSGCDVEVDDHLAKDAEPESAVARVRAAPDRSVLCTHGELLEHVLDAVRDDAATIHSERPDDDWLLLKGAIWELDVADDRFVALRHHVPVPVWSCPAHRFTD
jgi:8-oxo-(d)GTP phosphatase